MRTLLSLLFALVACVCFSEELVDGAIREANSADFVPSLSNTFDLGSSEYPWATGHVSTVVTSTNAIRVVDGSAVNIAGGEVYAGTGTNTPKVIKAGDNLSLLNNDLTITAGQLADGFTTWNNNNKLSIVPRIENNIGLNSFRIAALGSYSVFNMVDGIVDDFQDETGVNTGICTGQLYSAAGARYTSETQGAGYSLRPAASGFCLNAISYGASSNLTVAMWYKGSWVDTGAWLYYSYQVSGTKLLKLSFENSGNILWQWFNGSTWSGMTYAHGLSTNEDWRLIVAQHNGSSQVMDLWIDAAKVATATNSHSTVTIAGNNYIGSNQTPNSEPTGYIDELAVWYRLLTAVEITNLYNGGNGVYGKVTEAPFNDSLESLVHFDEGTGTTAANLGFEGDYTLSGSFAFNTNYIIVPPASTSATMVLVSTNFVATSVPDTARLLFAGTGAITQNVDVIGSVSRDSGTTFSDVTLSYLGTINSSTGMFSGTVDISGQPSDSNMVWKIRSTNSVSISVDDVNLTWN